MVRSCCGLPGGCGGEFIVWATQPCLGRHFAFGCPLDLMREIKRGLQRACAKARNGSRRGADAISKINLLLAGLVQIGFQGVHGRTYYAIRNIAQ